jgi:predicted alpha/beta hydrolase
MQSASDIFLGWETLTSPDGTPRDFYFRQLWDAKLSPDPETMIPASLSIYAKMCGWTLARAHARSGDAIAMTAYLGASDKFDQAMGRFAKNYADQNERDFEALTRAIRLNKVHAIVGL